MKRFRKYGKPPYQTAIVHGGPGAPGSAAPVAMELSRKFSILEPFQKEHSISGQIKELRVIILKHMKAPVILIGHSWGAWLVYLFAAEYPGLIEKIILVCAGPFEKKYAQKLAETRINRLQGKERLEYNNLQMEWPLSSGNHRKGIFARIGKLLAGADAWESTDLTDYTIQYEPEIFISVWTEADRLRSSGQLLEKGKKIRCHVTAIHGDYDPHPWKGVKEPLEKILPDFSFHLLEKCGHEPWKEKHARKIFFNILDKEISRQY